MRFFIGLLLAVSSGATFALGVLGPSEWSLPAIRTAIFAAATIFGLTSAACFWRPPRGAARVTVVMQRGRGSSGRPA